MRWLAVAAAIAAAIAVVACGDRKSDEDKVRETVTAFVEAGNSQNAERACELVTDRLKESIEAAAGGADCETAVASEFAAVGEGGADTEIEIEQVRISDDRATADVRISQGGGPAQARSILLERQGDDWKIADPDF